MKLWLGLSLLFIKWSLYVLLVLMAFSYFMSYLS
jgi:hypothetical protein